MATKAALGKVTALYTHFSAGSWVRIGTTWYRCQPVGSSSMLVVAADARRADAPVIVYYDDSDPNKALYEIYEL
jgi:hypothetical protein